MSASDEKFNALESLIVDIDVDVDALVDAMPQIVKPRVTVFGGGTFATALATVFARNGADVVMFMRDKDVAQAINDQHRNIRYFPDIPLLPNISASTDPEAALKDTQYILHAVPVQPSPDFLRKVAEFIPPTAPIISLSKGIHLESLQFMIDIIHDCVRSTQPVAILSGPSFAKELMEEQPTGMVVASQDVELAQRIQRLLSGHRLRVYTTTDVIGVEVGGALKNIYAIGAGIASGMGYKMNTAALIVTRGCSEMKKLAMAMGAQAQTLNGLSGIGDLMLTCFGPASRNRTVGVRLGQGEKLDAILASLPEVAEGIPTVGAVVKLADKYNVSMPLARGLAEFLKGDTTPLDKISELMGLPLHHED